MLQFNGEEFYIHMHNYAYYLVLRGMLEMPDAASEEGMRQAAESMLRAEPLFFAGMRYLRDLSDGYTEKVPKGTLPGGTIPPTTEHMALFSDYVTERYGNDPPDEMELLQSPDFAALWRHDYLRFMSGELTPTVSADIGEEETESEDAPQKRKRSAPRAHPKDLFAVHSSAPVYDIGETIARGIFSLQEDGKFPSASIIGGTQGRLELLPFWDHKNNQPLTPQTINLVASADNSEFSSMQEEAVKIATSYNEEMATYFYAMDAYWLTNAKGPDDYVELQIADLLRYTGKKPVKTHGKYTGTFRGDQLQRAGQMVYGMGFSMVEIERTVIRGMGERTHYRRLWDVTDMYMMQTLDDERYIESITYRPNEFFRAASFGSRRETALLMSKVLSLDYAKMVTARRLGRYYTWLWRDRAYRGNIDAPVSCERLLERAGVEIEKGKERYARRSLETALDRLEAEGIIAQWVLIDSKGNPADMGERISFSRWLEMKISVSPPDIILSHYAQNLSAPEVRAKIEGETDDMEALRLKLKEKRAAEGLTLAMLSEETGVELSTLSRIEAGRTKRPRQEHLKAIKKWLGE